VIAFRLLTGELPFASSTDQYEKGSVLPAEVMDAAGIPEQLADLLQHMCARTPSARLTAAEALRELNRYAGPGGSRGGQSPAQQVARDGEEPDYRELPQDYPLTPKYTIRRRLGRGTYGVVYQVYDDLAGADRAVKIVLRDRDSVVERLRQEYQVLINLPPHPNVVKVESADYLNGTRTPYIAFEYTAGHDVADLIKKRLLDPADVVRLGKDVARGLAFLHARSVWHCDIKPSNLFWTDTGCKILDFNVAVTADTTLASAPGGTLRYVPPDAGRGGGRVVPADLVDRDLYGLGIVLYELLAGVYPWDARQPPPGQVPRDPRTFTGLNDLSDALVDSLMKAISPRRSDRYPSADALLAALESIRDVHRRAAPLANQAPPLAAGTSAEVNPFVAHLKTLYSQSDGSNAGTRGRDPYKLYVSTALDDRLGPDVLAGRYLLVVITGNAGDGKTAFLESLTEQAQKRGADLGTPRDNGADFTFNGRAFHLNHDGSQDEGEVANDDVLAEFFAPYGGMDSTNWPGNETRLIAINEGRLVDFLSSHEAGLARLGEVIFAGLRGEPAVDGVLVVNLNRRDILADVDELQGSIFDRMLASMTNERHWEACGGCRLAKVCYATHNARTFAHPSAGARIRERLRALNQLVQLRGRMHITIRDLRSALAFMLTSGRDCRQIQQLYAAADAKTILDSFYFNSWLGAAGTSDRLLAELAEVDVAAVPDPVLDRQLDYAGPYSPGALRTVDQRGHYDRDLLQTAFQRLPRGARSDPAVVAHHTQYVAAARRRFYFECVDDERAARMLPYRTVGEFRGMLRESGRAKAYLADVIAALNRSEGMPDAGQLGDALALRLDHVPTGTIRSYRAFPVSAFSLEAAGGPESAYLEGGANELLLRHESGNGHATLLQIRLDLFELLRRLGDGYLPGIAESQGLYLALTIFKNELSAAPYQEVLLTTTGNDLRRIRRESDGRLIMEQLPGSEARWGAGGQHR
jgi:serine/threonine protein kinase